MANIEIRTTISPEGETTIEVTGARGPQCQHLTKDLERALGVSVNVQRKPEFYHAAAETRSSVDVSNRGTDLS